MLGLSMIGVAGAIVDMDFSGAIKAFLDTFNDSIYDGAVGTLFALGFLFILFGIIECTGETEYACVVSRKGKTNDQICEMIK